MKQEKYFINKFTCHNIINFIIYLMEMALFRFKFWMGFNSIVMLFLAVNIGTIGVEINSEIPFFFALGYLIYMSYYLSKNSITRISMLLIIAIIGVLYYLFGITFGYLPESAHALAWTHVILSLVLAIGALAHFKTRE